MCSSDLNPVKKRYYSAGRKSGGNYVANRALPIKPLKNVREELNTDMLDKHDGQKEKGKEKKLKKKLDPSGMKKTPL